MGSMKRKSNVGKFAKLFLTVGLVFYFRGAMAYAFLGAAKACTLISHALLSI